MPEEMGSLAIADPEVAAGSGEVVDSGAETVETASEEGNQTDSTIENEGLTEKPAAKGKLSLADVVKTKNDALKAIDPQLPAVMRTAAFELGGLYREFPGGLKEAVAAKTALSEIGGPDGIKETSEALADYGQLESLFEKGDPKFIESLADESPASFSQIMPAGLEKWKKVDPEMYNHVQARVMTQTLDAIRLPEALVQLFNSLDPEKNKEQRAAIADMWQHLEGYRTTGAKAPERKVSPQDEALTRREQQLAERETRALMAPVANAGRQQIQSLIDREMTAGYAWNGTDASVKEAIVDRVRQEVVNASKKDKAFSDRFERLKESGDAAGMERHLKDFQERLLVRGGLIQRVAKLFAVKSKGAPAVKKTVAQQNGKAPEQGWVRVSAQPTPSQMDRSKTTADMILDNKAILKDGKKVIWP